MYAWYFVEPVIELPLYGKRFTWPNKQFSPLLERLD